MDNSSDSDEYFTADEISDNESCEFILSTSPNGTPWIIPNPGYRHITLQTQNKYVINQNTNGSKQINERSTSPLFFQE